MILEVVSILAEEAIELSAETVYYVLPLFRNCRRRAVSLSTDNQLSPSLPMSTHSIQLIYRPLEMPPCTLAPLL